MDISITDLIVKTDRPSGPRGNDHAAAFANASSASMAAFNDLLARIDDRAQAPAVERPATDNRASRDDRDTRPASTSRDDRASRDDRSSAGTEAAREPDERRTHTSRDPHGNTIAEKGAVAAPPRNTRANDNGGTPSPKNAAPALPEQAVADDLTLPAAAAKNPVFNTDDSAANASPATAGKARAGAAGGAQAATAAAGTAPDQTARTETGQARPAQLTDFSGPARQAAEISRDENLAALAKSALAGGKGGNGDAGDTGTGTGTKAAEAAVQALRETRPERGADSARTPAKTEAGALRAMVTDQDTVPAPTPLRGPVVNGVIAAQEVRAQGTGAAQANAANGQGAPAPSATSPAAQTGANLGALRADMTNTAANAAAAPIVTSTEGTRTAFQSAGTGNQPLTLPGVMPGVAGQPGAQAQATAAPQAAGRAQAAMPVPVEDVAVHIARAAANGNDQISIKLKPASLGHVEVKLDVSHDGRVTAVITADRADTLDMLARDAKSLERALADAGLKTDSGNLQFNLRGDGQSGNAFGSRDDNARPGLTRPAPQTETVDVHLSRAGAYTNLRAASGGLDIRV